MPFLSHRCYIILLALVLPLSACNNQDSGNATPQSLVERPVVDATTLSLGQRIYTENCAACHGVNAEGATDWRQRDQRGMFPPPPLNGSGHMWHHPMVDLETMVRDGSPPGKGRMPAWKQRLDDDEIRAVILWLQSLWPYEIYEAWWRMEKKNRAGTR